MVDVIIIFLKKVYTFFTYFIAPPYCLFCRQDMPERKALCATCFITVLPIVPYDFHIGRHQTVKIYAMAAYKEPLRSLILSKHAGNAIPFTYLAELLCQQPILQHLAFDIIVFIPLHWTRYATRGFNQSEIIADHVAKLTGKSVIPLLVRSKKTQFQASLSADERDKNVQDAFTINKKYEHIIAGKKILLIDDLFTTGSTIKAAAHVLHAYQPEKIDAFVICRVVT